MKEIILLKSGEIALKGLNRNQFEELLVRNAKRKLKDIGSFEFVRAQSTISVTPLSEEINMDAAFEQLKKVFGISALSRACVAPKDFEEIKKQTVTYLQEELQTAKTFKVTAKRSDKKFSLNSPQICAALGEYILNSFPNLTVDVNFPQITVTVEIRDTAAYIHLNQTAGAGGMPVGSAGKGLLLISGGIDSPVAGYMLAKRGVQLEAIHFVSPPYTSTRALEKVKTLCEKISDYCGSIRLYVVPFTEIQEQIKRNCPEELFTIIMRRYMMKIAQKQAQSCEAQVLITGESLGQVASQTMPAIVCTDAAVPLPVFRPLIGMDKDEIIKRAEEIGTFETSILPYEDCCTVFVPKHPVTRPVLSKIEESEKALEIEELIERAMQNIEVVLVK